MRKPRLAPYFDPPPLREELVESTRRRNAELLRAGIRPAHIVYRKVWLPDDDLDVTEYSARHPHAPMGMDAFLLMSAIDNPPRPPKLAPGYRREQYDAFDAALAAAQMSTAQYAIERCARDLKRQRDARAVRSGHKETRSERNARHQRARADSGLSANAYATLHDGEDHLSRHQLRRIVSASIVAQKP